MSRRPKTTKLEIVRCATEMFLEQGYTATSPKAICNVLGLSTGNITYYFKSKEHLLAELVAMLCDFQQKMMESEANDGFSSVMAICLELTTMAAMCEGNEIAKDFYLSAYKSPICLKIIRSSDAARAKDVFKKYRPDWTDEQFMVAEIQVSGLEYAALMTTGEDIPLERRIRGVLDNILTIYGVPEEIRNQKISRALGLDYHSIAKRVFLEFKKYVAQENEKALEELLQRFQ